MATYNKRGYKQPKPEVAPVENEVEEVAIVDEKDSTTAGVFNTLDESASKIELFIEKNQKVIYGFVILVAVVATSYLLYDKFVATPNEEEANNELFQAQQYFQQAVDGTASDSLYNLALKGGEGKLGFVGIAENYAGTKAGNLANYYAGISYLNLKKYKEAVAALEQFSSDDAMLQAIATGSIGDAFAELDNNKEALSYYIKAAKTNDNSFTAPRYYYKAAQVAMVLNQKEEALSYFKLIKEQYETSLEAANVATYISMLEE